LGLCSPRNLRPGCVAFGIIDGGLVTVTAQIVATQLAGGC
jgi:hypothetical protein